MDNLESVCKHFGHCNIAKISGRDCSLPSYLDCQTYKFFQRYGKDYFQLGIGATMILPDELNDNADNSTNGK